MPFLTMRLYASRAILLIHIIMRHFVNVCNEHLIRVQVQIEGNGADAIFGPWRTEIAQFGSARPLKMESEATLLVHSSDHNHCRLREIAFQ